MNSKQEPTADGEQAGVTGGIRNPPQTLGGIFRSLGPGLIIAGAIVGSGELIATTSTGAEAGFSLLWLIIIGCLIKVFVQIEMGRYTIVTGQTSISGLSSLPGPRIGGGHLIVWFWFIMFIAIMGQLGGIVGGVGQALSISVPLTERGRTYNFYREAETQLTVLRAQWESDTVDTATKTALVQQIVPLQCQAIDNYLKLEAAALSTQQKDQLTGLKIRLSELEQPGGDPNDRLIHAQLLPRRDLADWVAAEIKNSGTDSGAREAFLAAAREQSIVVGDFVEDYVQALAVPPAKNRTDANAWTIILTLITIVILVRGRYGFIQTFSTCLVGLFTLVTIINVIGLQTVSTATAWSITMADIREGLSFGLPEGDWMQALSTALATFGIIGVGASELIAYPYWCTEHGYARFTGPRDDSPQWAERARGWMRVMRWDAWCSMLVYTFATVAFYLLGAAVLGRIHLVPAGDEMVRSLGVMYRPVFGQVAELLFLFGAFSVLYSTFFVASAGNARMGSDVFRTLGFIEDSEASYRKAILVLCVVLPLICAATSILGFKPVVMVLLSGTMQAMMLPMLAAAAIYFRYKKGDPRVAPGRAWDLLLIISAIGMLFAGGYAAYARISAYLGG
ncbi:MAG: transmembrane Mn(2+) transporter [Planctomycetaceae bacterium]|nr:transmembrane Mn(2+) transporter [Planctomycetaceae bacterium]